VQRIGSTTAGGHPSGRKPVRPATRLPVTWATGSSASSAVSTLTAQARTSCVHTDLDGCLAWIDTYCAAHPLDKVVTAATKLMDELRERASR